jgi:predicted ATPase
MTSPVSAVLAETSYVSPVLLGRAGQLDRLTRLIDAAPSDPRTVLVAGEAGIGKSRLIREASSLAAAQGYHVLQGTCFEHDHGRPYSAVLDLIRTHILTRPGPELETMLGPIGCEIVKLAPELALVCPSLVPTPPLDAAQEKARHFQALNLLVERMAAARPVLAVFEDVHWADETTLEFLFQFARRATASPPSPRVLLVLTYRTEQAGPMLAHLLAELERLRLATELQLDPLTRAETDVMLRAILGLHRPVRREYLEQLYQLTGGNPFFIEEVLKATSTAAGGRGSDQHFDRQPLDVASVPRTVQEAVTRRCLELSPPTRELLDAAAVTGQRFDLPLLGAVAAGSADTLLGPIKELSRGGRGAR